MSGIKLAIQDLINSNNLEEPSEFFVPEFKEIDLSDTFHYKLLPNSALALTPRVNHVVNQRNEFNKPEKARLFYFLHKLNIESAEDSMYECGDFRVIDLVKYFGVKVSSPDDIEVALDKLAFIIDDLASQGFIKGSLMSALAIYLADGSICVVTYPNLTKAGCEYADANHAHYQFTEGSVPQSLV